MDYLASENTNTKLTGNNPPTSDDNYDEEEVNDPVNIPTLADDPDDDPGDEQATFDQGQCFEYKYEVNSNVKDDVVEAVLNYLTSPI